MATKKKLRTKVLKTKITDCKHCPHSCWASGDKWRLLCTLFNGFIPKKKLKCGYSYPIPKECKLDDAE